jgi:Rne/Rng family ribonuclease
VIAAKRAQLAAPALLERGIGLVERLIRDVLPASAHIATDDKGMLTRLEAYIQTWVPDFVGRLELAADALFERHDAAGALAAALRPEVPLSGGGKLTIEPTTALTAIDVDCGLRSGAKRNALHTASIEAAAVAAEEIRRRNLVGMIVIDFPRPGDAASGEALVAEMRNRMSCDPVAHRVAGISASGLMEVTRRRGEMPLLDVLTEKRANGYGGRRPRLDALAFDAACAARLEVQAGARQVTLLAAPELAGYLRAVNPEAASADYVSLGTWLNAGVTVREDPAQRREDWAIEVD